MKFNRTLHVTDPDEVAAIAKAIGATRGVGSVTQYGEDRAPVTYELFTAQKPEYNVQPYAVALRDGDGWLITDTPKGKK